MSRAVELRDRLRRYYTTYYRDVLGIPDWSVLVQRREDEEQQERGRLERLRGVLGGDAALRGRLLNVGCGTGGFNVVAEEAGAHPIGVDADAEAIAICALKHDKGGGSFVRAAAERLPFPDAVFDVVYCFSAIEHVESVEETVSEMVRVARPGGQIYVHTPSAWSWYEGHYKLLWAPFLPAPVGRLYLRARGRPSGYLATLRRLTPGALRRAFARAGVRDLRFHDDEPARESVGPLRVPIGVYYRLTGAAPFIELVARKA
ncbi:MAG TPA: class I SAM-dependent methyltransferase [Candidatus Nitrosotalea sp.]|nr:class I SAM-dependent methyltransferase [Candidatus Nitrosotalea sp.]